MIEQTQVWVGREQNPAKQYLMDYRALVKRRDALLDELDRMREATMRATSRMTATRLSGTSSHGGMEDSILRVIDGEERLKQVIAGIDESLDARLSLIDQLTDERQKLVLTYRYINGLGWDEVIRKMQLSDRPVFIFHGKALTEISRLIQIDSKNQ
jgi:DNA-directed RNA polymerase specialized sigma subunit